MVSDGYAVSVVAGFIESGYGFMSWSLWLEDFADASSGLICELEMTEHRRLHTAFPHINLPLSTVVRSHDTIMYVRYSTYASSGQRCKRE
jgi:hypothetical protein